jgi:hypothetical protein
MFIIEDERHAERVGEYGTRAEAIAELRRLTGVPWDQAPNQAPCVGWETCGRSYELVEFDSTITPWRELQRHAALKVSKAGVKWLLEGDVRAVS